MEALFGPNGSLRWTWCCAQEGEREVRHGEHSHGASIVSNTSIPRLFPSQLLFQWNWPVAEGTQLKLLSTDRWLPWGVTLLSWVSKGSKFKGECWARPPHFALIIAVLEQRIPLQRGGKLWTDNRHASYTQAQNTFVSPPQKRKTFQDGFTIWHPKRQTSKGELVVFSLWTSKCKELVLTPSGVGNLHQAQHCSSSAAEPHVTPKWKHQRQSQRGTVSGLPFPPQTASAGTLRTATGMGPENIKCVNLKINSMTTVVPRSRCFLRLFLRRPYEQIRAKKCRCVTLGQSKTKKVRGTN